MDIKQEQVDAELFVRETLTMTANKYLRLKNFLLILGVLNLILFVIISVGSYVEMQSEKRKHMSRMESDLDRAKLVLSLNIKNALNDLFFLSDIIDLEYNSKDLIDVERFATSTLYDFIKNNPSYDQARILDVSGMEMIRVNRVENSAPMRVPVGELQDKSSKEYYCESIALASSVAFLSKLDLNMEHGEIEIPYKLVVRMATPIFAEGILEGVLVLNFLGSELLFDAVHILKQGEIESGGKYFMMNSKGEPLAYIEWLDNAIYRSLLGGDAVNEFDKTLVVDSHEVFLYPDGAYDNDEILFAKTTIRVDSTASKSNQRFDLVKVNVLPQDDMDESDLILISVMDGVSYWDSVKEFTARNVISVIWVEMLFLLISSLYSISLVKQKILENAIKAAAAYDPLTSVYNRRFGMLFLKYELKKISRSEDLLTLFVVDVNNLKKVNDTCGHSAGDRLLKYVAGRFKEELREYDIVSRIGGDEFIVAFAGIGLDKGEGVVERIRAGLAEDYKHEFSGIGVDFSYGGVEYKMYKHSTFEDFLREADERMYEDKKRRKQGRV